MANALLNQLQSVFPELTFRAEHPLAPLTTVKIGGPAEVFCETSTSDEFVALVTYARKHNIAVTLLGWGANTLIADRGIRGLVIKNSARAITIGETLSAAASQTTPPITPRWHADGESGSHKYDFGDLNYDESDSERVRVTLDSGVALPFAINHLLTQGITGLQWYSRIPATIGGAIYNNIHGGTHFISEVIDSVRIIDEMGEERILDHAELEVDYDLSRFHRTQETIVSADFLLYRGDSARAQAVVREWALRKKIQPQNSLGCVFQNLNPEDAQRLKLPTTSIGYIIEHVLKLKGTRKGDAQISERHSAFIENLGQATAADYLYLIRLIAERTHQELGIRLKPEIFFFGFNPEELAPILS